jgi:transposase, IS30 family
MKRPRERVSPELRREVIRRAAKGETYRSIAADAGVAFGWVGYLLRALGPHTTTQDWDAPPSRLSLEQRIEIRFGLEQDRSFRTIGEQIGRSASTVCREVSRNGGRESYRPLVAHRRARACTRRPKPTKLASNPRLRSRVIEDLQRLWSPEQIARRLREEFEGDPTMWVSHETIYASIYVQGRGELRKEIARCLRTGRAARKHRGVINRRGRIPDMVMISERPAEAEDRAVPGHWEGDLIIGKDGLSAIGTLVERSTRYVMLLHLPTDRTAERVRDAITRKVPTLPDSLWRTLTWDQGKELAEHVRITVDTGVEVYFCDPHSPWQRGSNENTNGLLRQYFPKGTDLSIHDEKKLEEVADSLNGRPRKTLRWKTPSEKLAELVASTA